jgi:hypothetical protein
MNHQVKQSWRNGNTLFKTFTIHKVLAITTIDSNIEGATIKNSSHSISPNDTKTTRVKHFD